MRACVLEAHLLAPDNVLGVGRRRISSAKTAEKEWGSPDAGFRRHPMIETS